MISQKKSRKGYEYRICKERLRDIEKKKKGTNFQMKRISGKEKKSGGEYI